MATPSSLHDHITSLLLHLARKWEYPHKTNVIHAHLIGLQPCSSYQLHKACYNSIRSKKTTYIKNLNLRKEIGITIKSKETNSLLKAVRNSYVTIMHHPVTGSPNMYQNACTNKAFSSTSTRFNPYFDWFIANIFYTNQSRD